jgi:hypothetical protein
VTRADPPTEGRKPWLDKTCARCGRHGRYSAIWPDGHICRTCLDQALKVRGRCPGCGEDRVLPGARPRDKRPICTSCAGFAVSYQCSRCGDEDVLHAGRLCARCTFADQLAELLDDGTGRIRPALVPLAEHLLAMNNPKSGLSWLRPSHRPARPPAVLLQELGRGEIKLTHEAFHTVEPWRAAAHLRELLMACGVLPIVDKQICSFERWVIVHLATVTNPEHARLVRRFVTWQVLPWLRARAEKRPLTPAIRRSVGDQVKHATSFLAWLARRNVALAACGQAHIDAWHVEHSLRARTCVRPFLLWCMTNKLVKRVRLPAQVIRTAAPLPSPRRLELLGRLLVEDGQPLRTRVAAAVVLIYAQPLARIVRLTLDDVFWDGDQVMLRLGEPSSPVPGPVAGLLLRWIEQRTNMDTATNRASRWLFPGRRAGQPMSSETLGTQVKAIGIPTVAARVGAIREHVLGMPAPVVADALGYNHATTTRLAAQAGAIWSRYAPGDHSR